MIIDAAIHAVSVLEAPTQEAVEKIEEAIPKECRKDRMKAIVMRDLHDIAQRATVALKGAAPTEPDLLNVQRLTQEDDDLFHVDAGVQERRGTRRRMLRELPERAADALAGLGKRVVQKIVPGWVWYILAGSGGIVLALWLWGRWIDVDRKRKARAYDALDDGIEAVFGSEERAKIILSNDAQREHKRRNDERKNGRK